MTSFPTSIITERPRVPNQFPIDDTPVPYRLAVVGEAPGEHEEQHGVPFVGPSGNFLNGLLSDCGISRHHIFVGNVAQVRPFNNDFNRFEWRGEEVQSGIDALTTDLQNFRPNITIALGNAALHFLKHGNVPPPFLRGKHAFPSKITSWRGSLLRSPITQTKLIGSLHPAFVLRDFSGHPLLRHDLTRAASEATSSNLILPQRELITNASLVELLFLMDNWPAGRPCSVDIEGGLPNIKVNDGVRKDSKRRRHIGWRCVSLADSPMRGYTIAWWKFDDRGKILLLKAFARLMRRKDVPKILQNSLYDMFVLMYGYGIVVRALADDTMLQGWEAYCELPKGLSTQASIWTREPHWKDDEMYESNGENLAIGCAKDTTVTFEVCNAQKAYFEDANATVPLNLLRLSYGHYRTNLEMINPAHYMEQRGMLYNQEKVNARKQAVRKEMATLGEALSAQAGTELRGEKGSLGAKRLMKALYETGINGFKYPPQFAKEEGKKTEKLTTDNEALLNLRKKHPGDKFLNGLLRHRHLEGLAEVLDVVADADGRVRCAYNVVGTDTGRFACKTSPTGAGTNMTTITKVEDPVTEIKIYRDHYIADPGHDFAQADLEGADGWTVASHCDRLGDPRMLLDYEAKMKPAKIIGFLYEYGPAINKLDRESLKWWHDHGFKKMLKSVGKWLYLGSKRVQHGSNYLMGIPTMIMNVLRDSFKESGEAIYLEHSVATQLQQHYFSRYPGIRYWHSWCQAELMHKGYLTSASGHTRVFFGRRWGKDIQDTLKQFLADEPQANTTWATNLAMLRLWKDRDNRIARREGRLFWTLSGTCHVIPEADVPFMRRLIPGALIIEPLHQVHDALCVQWPQFLRTWSRAKMRTYFDNPLEIAGRRIVIPFDGTWGPSWGDMPNAL